MTPPKKPSNDWSNTWWGKLLLGGGAVLVGILVNRLATGYENIRLIPQHEAKIEALEKALKALQDKQTYGEMLVQAKREAYADQAIRSQRFDDSLLANDRKFDNKLLRNVGKR